MSRPEIVDRETWRAARLDLLEREKELTRLRDEVAGARRALPWVRIDKDYAFTAPGGARVALTDLFGDKSQLIVIHFMFGPDWQAGCKSCSFWADSYDGTLAHLAARDVAFAVVSRAPVETLEAFKARMGWSFPWYSSEASDFNFDFNVSFPPESDTDDPGEYNYRPRQFRMEELPGTSVFAKGADGALYHTYSCYARGLDGLNAVYAYLDLVPKGRDEDGLDHPMAWVRLHDEY